MKFKYPERRHKQCPHCDVRFCDITSNNSRQFCSKYCSLQNHYKKERLKNKRNCKFCNKIFVNNGRVHYCSERCYRDFHLNKKYNLTPTNFIKLMEKTKCDICTKPLARSEKYIDHCHTTDKVRGVLCHSCNTGLGHFKDNITSLKNSIKYLTEMS